MEVSVLFRPGIANSKYRSFSFSSTPQSRALPGRMRLSQSEVSRLVLRARVTRYSHLQHLTTPGWGGVVKFASEQTVHIAQAHKRTKRRAQAHKRWRDPRGRFVGGGSHVGGRGRCSDRGLACGDLHPYGETGCHRSQAHLDHDLERRPRK